MIHLPSAAFSVFLSFRNSHFLSPSKQLASHSNPLLSVSTIYLLVSFISTRTLLLISRYRDLGNYSVVWLVPIFSSAKLQSETPASVSRVTCPKP